MGSMVESSSQAYRVTQGRKSGAYSMSAQDELEGWCTIIFSIAVGLLALGFFLALGGIFALVGPWMVFAAIHLFRQKWARKAGGHLGHQALQLVVSIRNTLSPGKQVNLQGSAATILPMVKSPLRGSLMFFCLEGLELFLMMG
jgi:hypothetical protein